MNIAIIICLVLGIICTGTFTINDYEFNINWACVAALILFLINLSKTA